jgi:hypothetical protein
MMMLDIMVRARPIEVCDGPSTASATWEDMPIERRGRAWGPHHHKAGSQEIAVSRFREQTSVRPQAVLICAERTKLAGLAYACLIQIGIDAGREYSTYIWWDSSAGFA